MAMPLEIIILAAGRGSRLNSTVPKVLHSLAGQPLLSHVVRTAKALQPSAIHVVIGIGADTVRSTLADDNLHWIVQNQPLGTGHAVLQAMPAVQPTSTVLVLYGDVPLVSKPTLATLLTSVNEETLSLLTVVHQNPTGYGRIVRNSNNDVTAIIEDIAANDEQRSITEINTGILAAPAVKLNQWLLSLKAQTSNGEHYLTDIVAIAIQQGTKIVAKQPYTTWEACGANTRHELSTLERHYQYQKAHELMAAGATLADPKRIDVRGTLTVGRDVFIDINCVFIGQVTLADHVTIGPGCVITNTRIDSNSNIHPYSVIDGSQIDKHCHIGPFARMRPGTKLHEKVKIGNFVETKQTSIGISSKINHLSYIGDTTIGNRVNVGAGTVTCNYDGIKKSSTTIGDGAFIGSNTSLIAPLDIGHNATIGAGSTINRNVDDDQLGLTRASQKNIDSWKPVGKK